jgi:hypothetical protein
MAIADLYLRAWISVLNSVLLIPAGATSTLA